MTGDVTDQSDNPARDIDALRKNYGSEGRSTHLLQWLIFAVILLLVVVISLRTLWPETTDRPILLYNAGFAYEGNNADLAWTTDATEQALNSYLDIGNDLQIINFGSNPDSFSFAQNKADWIISGVLSPDLSDPGSLKLDLVLKSQGLFGRKHRSDFAGVSTGLANLSARASEQIYEWLDQNPLSSDERATAQAELPATATAQKAFAAGQAAMTTYDSRQAIAHFEDALENGDHPMIYSAMGTAYDHMGLRPKSRAAHVRAYETREGLSRTRQLELEAKYLSVTNKKKRAREVFTALKEFHPHELSYRYNIISIFNLGAKPDLAMAEIDQIKTLPEPYRSDPRIGLYEARTFYQLGHFDKGEAAARRVAGIARENGDKGLLAEALLNSGNSDKTLYLAQLHEARDLYKEMGNPDKLSGVLTSIGSAHKDAGRLDEAIETFNEAIEISRQVGNEPRIAFVWNSMAIALDVQGKLSKGLVLKEKVAEYYGSRNIRNRHAIALENLNVSYFKLGRLEEAEATLDEVLPIFTAIKDSIGVAWVPMYKARIRLHQGELDAAKTFAEQALENSKTSPEGNLELVAKEFLTDILFWQGEYDRADEELAQHVEAYKAQELPMDAAILELKRARISMRRGDYAQAKTQMDAIKKIFDDAKSEDYILETLISQVDLAMLSFPDEVEKHCKALSDKLSGREYKLIALRARIREVICAGKPAPDMLIAIEEDAKRSGLFEPQIEAKIARIRLAEMANDMAVAKNERAKLGTFSASQNWDISWAVP